MTTALRIKTPFLLERYLLIPLALSIVACLLLFTILWIAPEILLKLIQAFQAHRITLPELFLLLGLQLPSVVVQSFPIAVLVGCVFTVRRLSHDFELTALQALGISFPKIARRFLGLGVVLAGFYILVQNVWLPWAGPTLQAQYAQRNIRKPPSQSFVLPITTIQTNTTPEDSPPLDELLSVGNLQTNTLSDVLLLKFYPKALSSSGNTLNTQSEKTASVQRLIQAAEGTYTHQNTVVLKQALVAEFSADGTLTSQRIQPEEVLTFPPETEQLLRFRATNPEFLSLTQLHAYQTLIDRYSLPQAYEWLKARIIERYLDPIGLLLLLLIGLLLGQEAPRKRTAKPFTLAAVVIFCYLVAKPLALQLSYLGELSGWLAGCIPLVVLFGLLVVIALFKPSMR
jgi:lipopolysaccharide export system permease protein